jgi:hypothetical protein
VATTGSIFTTSLNHRPMVMIIFTVGSILHYLSTYSTYYKEYFRTGIETNLPLVFTKSAVKMVIVKILHVLAQLQVGRLGHHQYCSLVKFSGGLWTLLQVSLDSSTPE